MSFLRQDANATESPHGDKVKLTVIAHSVRLSGAEENHPLFRSLKHSQYYFIS